MPARPTRPSILIVDDNEEIRDLLSLVLEEEGYEVRVASGGDEALRLVRERRPDLITLDLALPGKDGWTVLRELQSNDDTVAIPVLVISAFTRHLEGMERDQVAQVIPKPFYLGQIVSEVRAALASRAAGRGAAGADRSTGRRQPAPPGPPGR